MATFTCARCKTYFHDVRCSGCSSIYQSDHILCEACFFDEEEEIEQKGTNNIPETLTSYGPPNFY